MSPTTIGGTRVIGLELKGVTDVQMDVVSFTGTEGVSSLFSYAITLSCDKQIVNFDDWLEAKAHLSFGDPAGHIHGMLCSVQQGYDAAWVADSGQRHRVDVILVPELWKLTLNVRTKTYMKMTVKDIVTAVLGDHSLTPTFDFTGKHPKHDWVLQYQESDLDFIQRLCEHEGIHYHLVHKESKEDIVFADSNRGFSNIGDPSDLPLRLPKPSESKVGSWGPWGDEKTIQRFQSRQRFVPKKVVLQDYYEQTPQHDLKVEGEHPGKAAQGVQYFFGEHYKDTNEGEVLRDLRKEEIVARRRIYFGVSNAYLLYAGGVFKPVQTEKIDTGLSVDYVVTELQCEGSQALDKVAFDKGYHYSNTFTCIPKSVVYRPPLRTRWPEMKGPFVAKIIASGEDYSDVEDQGRYKVQFLFDLDKAGSPPLRRTQPYVGGNYGFHAPLHKGVEVYVEFENGDPHRPVIVGSVHNPQFPDTVVGGNHTQSIWRSGGNNEFKMDDTKGSELFYQHCQKDLDIKSENDKAELTGHDEKLEVKNNRKRKVGVDEKVEIGSNREKKVGSNEKVEIGADQEIKIGGNRTETVSKNEKVTVEGNIEKKVTGNTVLEVQGTSSMKYVKDQKVQMNGNSTNKITGDVDTSITGGRKESVTKNDELKVTGDMKVEVGGEIKVEVGGDYSVDGKGDISFDAGFLKTVSGKGLKIEFEAKTDAEIKCKNLKLEGKSGIEIKGAKYELKADGEVTVKGSTVKLN